MSALAMSGMVFACVLGGALLGMFLRATLPGHHLSEDSKDGVKLGVGLIATMAALVIGLLIASAKGSLDTVNTELKQGGANIILLDRVLARYGPETAGIRELIRRSFASRLDMVWPEDRSRTGQLQSLERGPSVVESFEDKILDLVSHTDAQRSGASALVGVRADW